MSIEETRDAFLGGRVHGYQPKEGFRAGTDTILLAAAVPAKSGDRVLELGAGSGIGLLALGARVPNLQLFGAEIVESNAERANRNLAESNQNGEVICANIFESKHALLKDQFNHVFMNPPFFKGENHSAPAHTDRAQAHILEENITDWIKFALKRVRAQGTLTIIYPTSGLDNIIKSISESHAIEIRPIQSKNSEPAKRILVLVRNQSHEPLILHPAIVLQNDDGGKTDIGECIARDGLGIAWSFGSSPRTKTLVG